jgi:hypothetical protein
MHRSARSGRRSAYRSARIRSCAQIATLERHHDETVANHAEDEGGVLEVEGSFREHGLAREQRLRDLLRNRHRPVVMLIVAIGERHEKARVGDPSPDRENPFRSDRSRGPLAEPARAMNGRWDSAMRAVATYLECARTEQLPR